MTALLDLDDPQEIAAAYLADDRPARSDRPWTTLGMIASLDGAATVEGGSTGLGGPPDRAVFRALRAMTDVILVGASTVNAEGYRAVRLPDDLVTWRREHGLTDAPRLAIVSNSLDLRLSDSLVESRPLIVTSQVAPVARLDSVARGAEVVVAGEKRVDFGTALAELKVRGAGRVLVEGGPRVNGQVLNQLDEVCVTIAPVLAGGEGPRIVMGSEHLRRGSLARIIHSDGFLLLRYLFD